MHDPAVAETPDQQALRTTFEDVAELYERARPLYPSAVFDDLVTLARLTEGGRIVEIGCGTGQATLPLAERGVGCTNSVVRRHGVPEVGGRQPG